MENAKRNIFYGLLQFIVSLVLPFAVRTILIYRFGVDYLGLNSLFASVLSVLSLMDLGFGTAVVYSLYKPAAEGNNDQICAYLAYYRRIYRFVGLAIFTAGIILIPFLKSLVKDPILPGNLNIYVCYLIFLSNAVISYLLYGYMTAVPTAFQRRDILSRVSIGMSLISSIIRASVLLLSSNFYLYLAAMPLLTIIHNLIIAKVVRIKYPDIECRGEITLQQKQELKKKVYGILINKLTNVSRNSIDSLCISAFLGLGMTGIYSNYYYIMSGILSCGIMICQSILPSVGNSIAIESVEKNFADMRKFDFIFMNIVAFATVCMLCLYQPFILLWVGRTMMFDLPVVVGFCAYFYILESGAIQWIYHQGAGLWWECRYIMIAEAGANIILNIILCKYMGVAGIILATIISVFATNYLLCPEVLFKKYFKNGQLQQYWKDHLWHALIMILTAGISWWLCENILPTEMVADRKVIKCILCLGGRLGICTATTISMFLGIWGVGKMWVRQPRDRKESP